jgi:hypothetical protein
MKPESFEDLVAKIVELDARVSALEAREAPTQPAVKRPSSGSAFKAITVADILEKGKK